MAVAHPRKVFVAGATGVVGSRTVRRLVVEGHEVTALARSAEKADQLVAWGATPACIDLFDAPALGRTVEGHDAVINLATKVPATAKAALPGAWKANDRIRAVGSRMLVDAALTAGARTYVQESVSFVYEDAGDRWIHEDGEIRQVPYLRSAMDSLAETERFTASGGAGVFLRFAMFYAPDANHVVDVLAFARRGVSIDVGDLDAYKSMIHADDAAAAVVAALDVPAGVYNVADDEPLTRQEHLELLADVVGRSRLWRPLNRVRRVGGSKLEMLGRSQRVSNQKLRGVSSWAPQWPGISEGYPAVVEALDLGGNR